MCRAGEGPGRCRAHRGLCPAPGWAVAWKDEKFVLGKLSTCYCFAIRTEEAQRKQTSNFTRRD